jgi:L-threonylcarbamoyladenylate synthase
MVIATAETSAALDQAVDILAAGGLVGMPTETVYGLAARADDDQAVGRIYEAKGRPRSHPLIVHVLDASAVRAFAESPSPDAECLMQAFWPGPVSLVMRRRAGQATAAAAGASTLAFRCPSHPLAQELLRRCRERGIPGLAAPSANRFGRVSPTRPAHVRDEFGPDLLVLDGGACEGGIESAIVDCTGDQPRLLRPGHVPAAQLQAVLGKPLLPPDAQSPQVSGSLASHYAPVAQVILCPSKDLPTQVRQLQTRWGDAAVALWARQVQRPPGLSPQMWSRMPDNARDAAHQLFDTLRHWDAQGVKAICVEMPPSEACWDGVLDRLRRAAAPR